MSCPAPAHAAFKGQFHPELKCKTSRTPWGRKGASDTPLKHRNSSLRHWERGGGLMDSVPHTWKTLETEERLDSK